MGRLPYSAAVACEDLMVDPYASCPCGSGKKFRFCCQAIYPAIERAFSQFRGGQQEAALRTIDAAAAAHPGHPEILIRKAMMLDAAGKRDDAEKALDDALAITPQFGPAHFMRARWRHQEGEFPGAAILARKAADGYALEAKEHLADIHAFLFEIEMQLNRPLAARAALRMAMRMAPQEASLKEAFEGAFGESGRLPACLRKEPSLLSPPPGSKRKAAWDKLAREHGSSRLGDLARLFTALAAQDASDSAAAHNAAVAMAWVGENAKALEHLERYLALETDDGRKESACLLGEILRCGYGMESQADLLEHEFLIVIRRVEPLQALINKMAQEGRLLPMRQDEEEQQNGFRALLLEKKIALAGSEAADYQRVVGTLEIQGPLCRVHGCDAQAMESLRAEFAEAMQLKANEAPLRPMGSFRDPGREVMLVALKAGGEKNESDAMNRQVKEYTRFFEETWVNRPAKSLGGKTPAEAALDNSARPNLLAKVKFIEDMGESPRQLGYDFDGLRSKLGLPSSGSKPAIVASTETPPTSKPSWTPETLASTAVESVPGAELANAFSAAQRNGDETVVLRWAMAIATRPDAPRHAVAHLHLARHQSAQGQHEAALETLELGYRRETGADDGRGAEFLAKMAQSLLKLGRHDDAVARLKSILDETKPDLKSLASGVEALLGAKHHAPAKELAEKGMAAAKQSQNRDAEGHFEELARAAGK